MKNSNNNKKTVYCCKKLWLWCIVPYFELWHTKTQLWLELAVLVSSSVECVMWSTATKQTYSSQMCNETALEWNSTLNNTHSDIWIISKDGVSYGVKLQV